jgi:hypothetical protein
MRGISCNRSIQLEVCAVSCVAEEQEPQAEEDRDDPRTKRVRLRAASGVRALATQAGSGRARPLAEPKDATGGLGVEVGSRLCGAGGGADGGCAVGASGGSGAGAGHGGVGAAGTKKRKSLGEPEAEPEAEPDSEAEGRPSHGDCHSAPGSRRDRDTRGPQARTRTRRHKANPEGPMKSSSNLKSPVSSEGSSDSPRHGDASDSDSESVSESWEKCGRPGRAEAPGPRRAEPIVLTLADVMGRAAEEWLAMNTGIVLPRLARRRTLAL